MTERSHLVFIGSHLGYPLESVPLGGGARVGVGLVRAWAGHPSLDLTVLGSGPEPPAEGASYCRMDTDYPDPTELSVLEYARFSRQFGACATRYVLHHRRFLDPARTCIVVNDISESPDLEQLKVAGYRLVSLWHVDVVDYFSRFYLRGVLDPILLTRAYETLSRWGIGRRLPGVLRLVFGRQRESVRCSDRIIVPSARMREFLLACYEGAPQAPGIEVPLPERVLVVPWGGWGPKPLEGSDKAKLSWLKAHYQIHPETVVLLTLSRLSREKGLDLFLKALKVLERRPKTPDLCVFICGEPAFMGGRAHTEKLRSLAASLERCRVFFPGYLAPEEKSLYLALADLFVSPSLHESYGLSVVEALQAGLPVLSSDSYGVQEILRPSFGEVVPYPSARRAPEAIADALARLVADKDGLRSMGEKAREAARGMSFERAASRVLEAALGLLALAPLRIGQGEGVKFLVDCMLGRLARWLLILGYDTAFVPTAQRTRDALVWRGMEEGRTLLTRDTLIPEGRGLTKVVLRQQHFEDQLRVVLEQFGLKPDPARRFSRCLLCNEALVETPQEEGAREAPPRVALAQERYFRCPKCRKLYWPGTHVEKTVRKMERMGLGKEAGSF